MGFSDFSVFSENPDKINIKTEKTETACCLFFTVKDRKKGAAIFQCHLKVDAEKLKE